MLKRLLAEVKEYKLTSLLTPVFMIGEVIVESIIPLMMGWLVDDGVTKGDLGYIARVGLYMLACAVFGLIFGMAGAYCSSKCSAGFAKNIRKAQYEKIQTFSFANIDKFSTAGLVTRLTTDTTNLQMSYMMILRMFTRAPASMLVAMVMAFSISAKIASIYLVAMIFLACFILVISSKAHKYFRQVFEKYDALNASVQENVSAIRVVKAYVREDHENDKFTNATKHLYEMFIKAESRINLNQPVMQIVVYTCILLVSWFGANMIVASGNNAALGLTTGNLTSLLAYCSNILSSLMMLGMVFVMITMSAAAGERVCQVLNEEPDIQNPENPETVVADGSIRFDHATFAYGRDGKLGEPVLHDINLEIRSGETIGIMGGTGSSKTSLVQLIPRLYDTTEGAVYVGGKDVRSYDITSLRNSCSMVLQKNVLFSGTIYENLRWGDQNATDEECREAARMACADEFIERFPDGYNTYIEQGGSNVSGGQKQRLCIARALLKKPKILILDDSTSAVDTATDARIREAFAKKIPGTTKIIIAQRISSVQDADRIIVLDDGRISGIGTHAELLENNEIYREVYLSQTQGGSGDFDKQNGGEQ